MILIIMDGFIVVFIITMNGRKITQVKLQLLQMYVKNSVQIGEFLVPTNPQKRD